MILALLRLIAFVVILGLVGTAIASCVLVIPVVFAVALGLALLAAPLAILLRILRWGLR